MNELTHAPKARDAKGYLSFEMLEEYYSILAHQMSALGVQASATRSVMTSSPEAAMQVLESLDESARSLSTVNTYLLRYLEESWGQWLREHQNPLP